jgi:hypothetical protein
VYEVESCEASDDAVEGREGAGKRGAAGESGGVADAGNSDVEEALCFMAERSGGVECGESDIVCSYNFT